MITPNIHIKTYCIYDTDSKYLGHIISENLKETVEILDKDYPTWALLKEVPSYIKECVCGTEMDGYGCPNGH